MCELVDLCYWSSGHFRKRFGRREGVPLCITMKRGLFLPVKGRIKMTVWKGLFLKCPGDLLKNSAWSSLISWSFFKSFSSIPLGHLGWDNPYEGNQRSYRGIKWSLKKQHVFSKSSFVVVKGAKFSKYSVLNREGYKKF